MHFPRPTGGQFAQFRNLPLQRTIQRIPWMHKRRRRMMLKMWNPFQITKWSNIREKSAPLLVLLLFPSPTEAPAHNDWLSTQRIGSPTLNLIAPRSFSRIFIQELEPNDQLRNWTIRVPQSDRCLFLGLANGASLCFAYKLEQSPDVVRQFSNPIFVRLLR